MRLDDPATLVDAPLGALDERWAEGLRQRGPSLREAWLEAADGLHRDGAENGTRARRVYWTLRSELDPLKNEDVPRFLHVLRSGLERDSDFAALATRATESSDERLRLSALLCVAQCLSVAAKFEEAERRLREVLSQVRGSGTRLERTAYASLAVVYQNQRREFEALVLTRIVLRLSAGASDPWEACVAHQQHCALLDALGSWDEMDAALDDLERALRIANPPWAWTMWRYIHGERAEAALERDDVEQARESVRHMHDVVPQGTEDVAVPRWHPLLAARLALAQGRPGAALEHLGSEPFERESRACIVAVRASLALGDDAAALRFGRACLDALEVEREVWGGAVQRLWAAANIATLFEDHHLDPTQVRRAYDMAAEAAMRRIFELEHTIAHLPDLGVVNADDMATLASFRLRFREGHGRLLDRLSGYLTEELEDGPFAVKEGHLRVCAWCHRIASRAESWLPAGHLLPSRVEVPVTHTICPECIVSHGFG